MESGCLQDANAGGNGAGVWAELQLGMVKEHVLGAVGAQRVGDVADDHLLGLVPTGQAGWLIIVSASSASALYFALCAARLEESAEQLASSPGRADFGFGCFG